MAFNRAPSQSTYQTKDVKLIMTVDNRDAAGVTDVIPLNGFYDIIRSKETGDNDYHFVKRDGLSPYGSSPTGTVVRGMYFWEDQDKLFVAYDDKIDITTASTGAAVTTLTPFTTTTGDVGFTEFQYADGSVKLVVCDGEKLITIDSSNTVVTGSDADMPTPMNPHVVYLDGYIFMVKDGTSDIYNSDLDDPLAWTAGDYITAEMEPDKLVRIARSRNYILAFGTSSIEYFYDAANSSGSPLNRNDTPMKQVGYLGGMASHGSRLYFVGQTANTAPELYFVEDFKIESNDSSVIRRHIRPNTAYKGAVISMGGRDFYVLNTGDITFMIDLQTKVWTRLAFKNNATFPISFSSTVVRNTAGHVSVVAFDNTTSLYYFNPNIYQDDGVDFLVKLQTDKQMFDTYHRKFMSRLMVVADRPPSDANLSINWTDDDYQTDTVSRTVNLNQSLPVIYRLGHFRRRAFILEFTANSPLRLHHLEVDFNIGSR